MGRRRTKDKHLPRRMYLRSGTYYFDNPATGQWVNLGHALPDALAQYGVLVGGAWSGRTLGDVIDRYRAEVLPLKFAGTRKLEDPQLVRLKAVFGHMLPDSVTPPHLYEYLDKRRDKDGRPAPSAARHEIGLLGHVYAKAIRWGVAVGNPVRKLERSRKPKRLRYVTDADYLAVRKHANARLRIAMDLALLTGLRRGDLLKLTRAHLTEKAIEVTTSKTGAGVAIGWTPRLREVVEQAKRQKPQVPGTYLLRTREGRPYTPAGFSAIWKRAVARAVAQEGIESFTFHDLRRKSASDSGTLAEARARLGHSSEAVTAAFYVRRPMPATALESEILEGPENTGKR